MEEEGQRRAEKCFSSAASRGSSCTSGCEAGSKARMEDEGWQEEGERIFILKRLYIWEILSASLHSLWNKLMLCLLNETDSW